MKSGEDETAVVPDLICFKELDGQDIHKFKFFIQRSVGSQDGMVSILPTHTKMHMPI